MSPPERTAVADAARYFDSWLGFRAGLERVPGVQAAVLHDDDVVLSTAHGVSSVATGEPLSDRHLFRIASHSKTFTATAVFQLAERGALRLDDTVGHWIGELDGSAVADVTVRDLLSHAGGIVRDGWDGDFWQLHHPFPDREALLRIAADDAAVLPRNQRFKYSNIAYSLAGLVVAAASRQSYNEYVSEHIVAPLGLTDLGPELDERRLGEYAGGHTGLGYADERVPIEHVDTAAMSAATGFFATARDLVRYASAHFDGDDRLLGDDAKRQMQHVAWDVDGDDSSYGLGFGISTIGGRRVLGHGGGYPGHITRTFFDPTDRLAVSVLTNTIDGPAMAWATAAIRLIDLAATTDGERRPHGDLERFEGRFATLWGVYDVVALGGRLFQIGLSQADPAASTTRLEVIDDSTLRIAEAPGYASPGERLDYHFDGNGAVLEVRGGSANAAVPLADFRAALADTSTSAGVVRLGWRTSVRPRPTVRDT